MNTQRRLVDRFPGRIGGDTSVTSRVVRRYRLDQHHAHPWPEFPDVVSHELREGPILVGPGDVDGGVTRRHHARQLGGLPRVDRLIPKIERTDPWQDWNDEYPQLDPLTHSLTHARTHRIPSMDPQSRRH